MHLTDWGRVIDTAREIATNAHATQLDKGGQPYIEHPDRVSRNVHSYIEMLVVESKKRKYEDINDVLELSGNCVAAAWLHDVIEDSGDHGEQVTADDLRAAGIPESVVHAVILLTDDAVIDESLPHGLRRRAAKFEHKLDYYARINADRVARIVKLADLADNNNIARGEIMRAAGGSVDPAKYPLALAALGLSEAEWTWFERRIALKA